jgi:hypothetical protein
VLHVKYWETVADNLKKVGWNCGSISSTDHKGRQFWVVAAEREDAGRIIGTAGNGSTVHSFDDVREVLQSLGV